MARRKQPGRPEKTPSAQPPPPRSLLRSLIAFRTQTDTHTRQRETRQVPSDPRRAEPPVQQQSITPLRILLFATFSALLWIAPACNGSVRETYLRNFIPIADFLFRSATDDVIRFYPALDTRTGDFELRCTNRKLGRRTVQTLKSGMLCLLPTLGVIALCAATPLPFVKRGCRLLIGLILVHLFILLRLGVAALYWISEGGESAVLPLNSFLRGLIEAARIFLVTSPTTSFVAPLLIWLIAMIRPGEWRMVPRQAAVADTAVDSRTT